MLGSQKQEEHICRYDCHRVRDGEEGLQRVKGGPTVINPFE